MDTPQNKFTNDLHLRGGTGNTPPSDRSTLPGAHRSKPLDQGKLINERYKVVGVVGQGGTGRVYLVEQVFLKKKFALKTLNHTVSSTTTIRRFQQEAQAARGLNHPNLVRAVDFGVLKDGHPFFVMDFVEGQSLAQHLMNCGTMSVEDAVNVFIPICSGLAYAHEQGIVHRDIKPGNIVLVANDLKNGWIPKIVDFGIARLNSTEMAEALTVTGDIFGTPHYMSPEQCAGEKADQRSDIYSLGCVLFEMLTGGPPFRGESALSIMMQHSTGSVPSLKEVSLGREFPHELEGIVLKALSKEASNRYQSCDELSEDLEHLRQGTLPKKKRKEQLPIKGTDEGRTFYTMLAAVCAVLLVVLGFGIRYLFQGESAKNVQANVAVPQPVPVTKNLDKIMSVSDTAFFYRTEQRRGTKVFQFPDNSGMAVFKYWPAWKMSGRPNSVMVKGEVKIPSDSRVVLELEQGIISPNLVVPFQTGDIWGADVNIDKVKTEVDIVDVHDLSARANCAVAHLRPVESLQYLSVKSKLDPRVLGIIGQMPALNWLRLTAPADSWLDGYDIAHFENLPNLKYLALSGLDTAGPLLAELNKRNAIVSRLSLENAHLTEADVDRIATLKSLRFLNVSDNFDRGQMTKDKAVRIITKISKITYLENLSLSSGFFLDPETSRAVFDKLAAMPKLNSVYILDNEPYPTFAADLNAYKKKSFRLEQTDNHSAWGFWFDPVLLQEWWIPPECLMDRKFADSMRTEN